MKKVYDSFQSFPSDLPIRMMYRSTLPGHEYCMRYHYPVTMFEEIARDPTPSKNHYHYHWFPEFNAFAKGLWDGGQFSLNLKSTSNEQLGTLEWRSNGRSSVTTEYWDVWNMAVTRPDAHVGNDGKDCLHVSVEYSSINYLLTLLLIVLSRWRILLGGACMVGHYCSERILKKQYSAPKQHFLRRNSLD